MKDGDIFHWSYKDEKKHNSSTGYWCKSRIAVVKGGYLIDTYWGGASDNSRFKLDGVEKILELDFIANENNLINKSEYEANYYAKEDCVNLNHPNSTKGNFYIFKGAKRCPAKIRASINAKIEDHRRDIKSAEWAIKCAEKELAKLDSGEPLESIYL